ncbi:MAG: hypothetical protein ACP5D7_22450 [Limnospira sp.]
MTYDNETVPANSTRSDAKKMQFIEIISWLSVAYLAVKLFFIPVASFAISTFATPTSGEYPDSTESADVPLPEITFADIGLIAVILLFQPATATLIQSIKISPDGIEVQLKELTEKVDRVENNVGKMHREVETHMTGMEENLREEMKQMEGRLKNSENENTSDR